MTKLPYPTQLLMPIPSSCDALSIQVDPDITGLLNTLSFYDKWRWDYGLNLTEQIRRISYRPQFTILNAAARDEIQASHEAWEKDELDRAAAEKAEQAEAEDAA